MVTDGRKHEGLFVDRARALEFVSETTGERRDPLLVSWHDVGWIDVSVFPLLGAGEKRRLELEWIEPAAATSSKGFVLARGRIVPKKRPPRILVSAETSASMTAALRASERKALGALLSSLPTDVSVRLVAADWLLTE